jgi:hypothetical protein
VEQVRRIEEAVLGGHLFGGRAVLFGHAWVGTVREEEAQNEEVTVRGGEMQRGRACPLSRQLCWISSRDRLRDDTHLAFRPTGHST